MLQITLDFPLSKWYNMCIGIRDGDVVGPNTQKNTPARQAAQAKYNAKPEQKKRRAQRNQARAEMMAKGAVKKGDGKDVDHKSRNLGGNLNNNPSNLRVRSKAANRSIKKK